MIVCFDIGGTAIKDAVAHAADHIRPFPASRPRGRISTPS